ncbi:MAG: 3-phosphoshikimate 1-carboxyvinyltransferase [Gammaproteobacteria bacterium]
MSPNRLRVQPGGSLRGRARVPGDKSISHRAIMLGAIAEGVTEICGFLEGEDTLATRRAFEAMGVSIEDPGPQRLRIHGVGLRGLRAPAGPLFLGNSGTSMRLMAGLLAGQAFDSDLTGDASLCQRPMRRVVEPLARMGAVIETSAAGTAPLKVTGGRTLRGIDYELPMASAQVKSCLLLAGLYAQGRTCVGERWPSRDHTERMLPGFGYALEREAGRTCLNGGGCLHGTTIEVPADLSSAAFFLVGAAIAPGSELLLEGVGVNPTRTGVITVLREMGATIEVRARADQGGEPLADLAVRGARLRGITIPETLVPLTIDELPALFIAAACAEGETLLSGAEELRHKESDRIAVMAQGLNTLGIQAEPRAGGIRVVGGRPGGGRIESAGDHRVAMSFAIAALRAATPIEIEDCENIDTSFPGFAALARSLGLGIEAC